MPEDRFIIDGDSKYVSIKWGDLGVTSSSWAPVSSRLDTTHSKLYKVEALVQDESEYAYKDYVFTYEYWGPWFVDDEDVAYLSKYVTDRNLDEQHPKGTPIFRCVEIKPSGSRTINGLIDYCVARLNE
jgi:hypothetical protein